MTESDFPYTPKPEDLVASGGHPYAGFNIYAHIALKADCDTDRIVQLNFSAGASGYGEIDIAWIGDPTEFLEIVVLWVTKFGLYFKEAGLEEMVIQRHAQLMNKEL